MYRTFNKHITIINKNFLSDEMYLLFHEQAVYKRGYKDGEYKSGLSFIVIISMAR